jgi:hypothetical protein
MKTRTKFVVGAGVVLAVAGVATGVSVASGADDPLLSGEELERASAAAIAHVGEGTVVEAEAGDGDDAYEVAVELADGSVVEINLDEGFNVVGSEGGDGSGEGSDGDSD